MSRQHVLNVPVPAVEERNRKIESEPLPPNIGALLDAAAADVPDRIAWNFFESGESITYSELRERVDRLANGMAEAGIDRATHVGVMLPNVAALPTTWLALARMGAVMVPINIAYTPREISFVVENGDVEWLVIDAACLPSLAKLAQLPGKLDAARIFVTGPGGEGYARWDGLINDGSSVFTPSQAVALDDVANIQYTTGTTGFPKGCVLSHRYWLTISKVNARRRTACTPQRRRAARQVPDAVHRPGFDDECSHVRRHGAQHSRSGAEHRTIARSVLFRHAEPRAVAGTPRHDQPVAADRRRRVRPPCACGRAFHRNAQPAFRQRRTDMKRPRFERAGSA